MATRQRSPKKAPPRRSKRAAFLAAYVKCGNISLAARRAQVSRQQHYEWMKDPKYSTAFAKANEKACDLFMAEVQRRTAESVKVRERL